MNLNDLENMYNLATKYKRLKYEIDHVYPNITSVFVHTQGKSNPEPVLTTDAIIRSITDAGIQEFNKVITDLMTYNVDIKDR